MKSIRKRIFCLILVLGMLIFTSCSQSKTYDGLTREEISVYEYLTYSILEVTGEETTDEKNVFMDITNYNGNVQLSIRPNELFISKQKNIDDMLKHATEFYKIISADEEVMTFDEISIMFITTDYPGRSGKYGLIYTSISTAKLKKTDWKHFEYKDLPDVLSDYIESPLL